MKACIFLTGLVLIMTAAMLCMTGCKYDGPTAIYDQPHAAAVATPVISALIPDTARAGFNYITIAGENFAAEAGNNKVYFGNVPVDAISESATALTVRRPNLTGDSITVKVVTYGALGTASRGPYRIDPVIENYGSFIENSFITAVAVDADENIYVTSTDSMFIFKVAPGAQKVALAKATQVPMDIKVGPDNRLYMVGGGGGTGGNKTICTCDLQTGIIDTFVVLTAGKNVKFGEFDANGYFYVGGTRTDIYAIAPNATFAAANLYASGDIVAMKIYNNYLYVAAKTGSGSSALTDIYKHAIGDNGALGAAVHVLNWTTTQFGTLTIRGFTFSADGVMYIATESVNPMLVLDPLTNELDYFYKGIVPSYIRDFNWGNGNYLYLVRGNTSLAEDWTVYRVDMGTTRGSN